jgi:hypothetical protein
MTELALPQALNLWHGSVVCGLGLMLCAGATARAQAVEANGAQSTCFAIHVRLNGNLVDGPKAITYKTKNGEQTALLEGNCFRVPDSLLKEETVDIFFTLPNDKIYLSSISTGFLAGPWDVELKDKHFGRGWPKHARNKESCNVVFHGGEPERGMFQTPCRTPLLPKSGR